MKQTEFIVPSLAQPAPQAMNQKTQPLAANRKTKRRFVAALLTLALYGLWLNILTPSANLGFTAQTSSTSVLKPIPPKPTTQRNINQPANRWLPSFLTLPMLPLRNQKIVVGLQIGHAEVEKHPYELAHLRQNTGGYAIGVYEVDINRTIVMELKTLLEAQGIVVEVLPATLPPNYQADLFLSVHADSVSDARRKGYKSAFFKPNRNTEDPLLKYYIDSEYLNYSGLHDDTENISPTMREFYAFNRIYQHSLHPDTPGLVVELGYISHPDDLAFLQTTTEPAKALYHGIVRYLSIMHPNFAPVADDSIYIPEMHLLN